MYLYMLQIGSGEAMRGEETEKRSKLSSPRDSAQVLADAKCEDDS